MKEGFAKFTGDTGHTLDWQIGFEDPMYGDTFNFLGIAEGKQEKKKRAKVLADIRAMYPSPTSCATATSGLVKIRTHLADAKKRKDAGAGGVEREMEGLNTVLNEYTNYINSNCLEFPVAALSATVATNPAITDNKAAATPAVNEPVVTAAAGSMQTITDTVKKVPTWVWWAAGGALVLITTIVIIASKTKQIKKP